MASPADSPGVLAIDHVAQVSVMSVSNENAVLDWSARGAHRTMKRVTVLLADDHSIVIEGLRRVLDSIFTIVGGVSDGGALVAAARALEPDVVVADISMPVLNGIEAARQIRQMNQHVKIVFFTMHADVLYASAAVQAGGSAYVLKSSAGTVIVTAIREVLAGRTYITPDLDRRSLEAQIQRNAGSRPEENRLPLRQREVLQMAAQGQSTKQIAGTLGISPRTVEFHRYQVMKSLDVHSIAELVKYAIKHHFVSV
jgi:DNA-binding NarL/FixJ family response regulator